MYKEDILPWIVSPEKDLVQRVEFLINSVLYPESINETSSVLPSSHLDRLLSSGLVNVVTSDSSVWNTSTRFAITEQIAFACLDTWFVITQHWGASSILLRSDSQLASFWDGKSLLGVGFGHLRRAIPCLTAEIGENRLVVRGKAPWVTGSSWLSWVVYGATLPDGRHLYFRLPHTQCEGYHIGEPQDLVAVRRTDTREVRLDISMSLDYIVETREASDLSAQDDVTLITSMAPILGLAARCLKEWHSEIKSENLDVHQALVQAFRELRANVYETLIKIGDVPVSDRLRIRQELHTLLETVVHLWSLTSGGQSNSQGMPVVRRRQEAAFFRLFQQTKQLKNAAVRQALDQIISVP